MELVLLPVAAGLLTAMIVVVLRVGLVAAVVRASARQFRVAMATTMPILRARSAMAASLAASATGRVVGAAMRWITARRGPDSSKKRLSWVGQTIGQAPAIASGVCRVCQHPNTIRASTCERCDAPLITTVGPRGGAAARSRQRTATHEQQTRRR
ncbi:MAG: hypothetical protein M3466_03035 [Gemmatimonadota bacterium]|nr:hypothetical protein [Gemmatimonadota bacterium]